MRFAMTSIGRLRRWRRYWHSLPAHAGGRAKWAMCRVKYLTERCAVWRRRRCYWDEAWLAARRRNAVLTVHRGEFRVDWEWRMKQADKWEELAYQAWDRARKQHLRAYGRARDIMAKWPEWEKHFDGPRREDDVRSVST